MSFILDALKKSENERQRRIGPSLADVQIRRREGERPWWVVAVVGLLVINLGVLLIVLARNDSQPASFTATPRSDAPSAPAATPAHNVQLSVPPAQPAPQRSTRMLTHEPTSPSVRSLADEAGAYDPSVAEEPPPPIDLAAASAVPEGPPLVRPINPPAVAPAASGPVFEARAAADNEMLPTLSTLTASGTRLPELHLDIHVSSKHPNERFVFVNMRKYVEGQTLSEGPTVERITPDGVILNQRGLRFLLPRQ